MIAETKYGKIQGIDKGSYVEYRGVPYAKPPVGKLRWRPPQEPEPWKGVYQADSFRNRCVMPDVPASPPYDRDFYSRSEYDRPMNEDCLYLQIWAPKKNSDCRESLGKDGCGGTAAGDLGEASRDEKFPVAFWIHGGGFMGGYSSEIEFDGKAYCDRGVILVSVEYRCNVFGFLAHPWLTEEDERRVSGNYGILDQIAALKWVYENIGAFGGDRDNITVFGQSAGAMSVQTLISSRLTEGMIAKAVMQSGGSYGSGLLWDLPLAKLEEYGKVFGEILEAESLEDMRAKTTEEIAAAIDAFMGKIVPLTGQLFLIPNVDGYVLEDGYYRLMDQGKIRNIPCLLGTTKDDIMVTPEMAEKGEYSPLYRGAAAFSEKLEELGRNPAYVYYFTRDLPGDSLGAWHSCELWYMFGTLDRCWRPWEERDRKLSGRMLDYWVSFMKTGDPNGEGPKEWRPCRAEDPFIKILE